MQITARVDSITNTDAWAKAGVMIRESLDPGSKQAFTCVTAQNGVAYQRRTVTGAASVHTPGPLKAAPYWVRLSRIGTTVTSSCSADGVTWQVVATETLSLSAKVYIGLAVTSHHNGTLCTAVFSNVAVVSAPSAAN